MNPIVVTHGGAGAQGAHSDGCVDACRAALAALRRGESALHAAAAAVRVLEDDERFNAGRGAAYRLDGLTIQLDAGVADEHGCGAVAGLENVRHPVDVALAVHRSPHVLITGLGAQALAKKMGVSHEDVGRPDRRAKSSEAWAKLQQDPRWTNVNVDDFWNFATSPPPRPPHPTGDTVGAVVRDANGKFACAGSTGGTAWSLLGRVGDTPVFGSGFYVGPAGALVATGIGEEIIRRTTCKTVHDVMERGSSPSDAVTAHCASFPDAWDIGLLAVGKDGWAARSNRDMPWAALIGDDVVGRG